MKMHFISILICFVTLGRNTLCAQSMAPDSAAIFDTAKFKQDFISIWNKARLEQGLYPVLIVDELNSSSRGVDKLVGIPSDSMVSGWQFFTQSRGISVDGEPMFVLNRLVIETSDPLTTKQLMERLSAIIRPDGSLLHQRIAEYAHPILLNPDMTLAEVEVRVLLDIPGGRPVYTYLIEIVHFR